MKQRGKAIAIRSSRRPTHPSTRTSSRREFLKTAVAAGIGAAAAATKFSSINIATAQAPIVWKMQSGWPTRDFFHESAIALAQKINEMSGGRIKVDLLPAGAVVGAFAIADAVHSGLLDAGHAVGVYAYSKSPTTSLFGTGPSFGMDARPARKMTTAKGIIRQAWTAITEPIASFGSASHCGGSILLTKPRFSSVQLMIE